jgi:2-hydroxy-3-keto-5-methylthiopentenyl-1-phosphate phosphatase
MNTTIFIDFDGTITSEETLSGVLRRLNPPGATEIEAMVMKGQLNLRDGITKIFALIPSSRFPEIMDYIKNIPLRKGFAELLQFAYENGFDVIVISGGLSPMVDSKLAPYKDMIKDIYSVDLLLDKEYMALHSDYTSESELMDKVKIIEQYQPESDEAVRTIVIGDGMTDFNMARTADIVFARDHLEAFLKSKNIPYYHWNDFFDIKKTLEEMV